MDYDINEILQSLLDRLSRVSEVDREFQRMIDKDPALMECYEEWCESNGYDTRTGYQDYVDELRESRDSVWDSMNE